MRFTVSMKDPDTLDDAITDAIRAEVQGIPGLSARERQVVEDERAEAVRELCGRWFEHGEYLRVEIDTEAKTCVVKAVRS